MRTTVTLLQVIVLSYASSIVSFLVEPARCVNRNAPPTGSDDVLTSTQATLQTFTTALSWLPAPVTNGTPAAFGNATAAPCIRYTGLSWATLVNNLNSMCYVLL